MGRAFEFRRARKEKRWANMSKTFTKLGKEISVAVKQGGPDPELNPRLRVIIQNAKAANMPKDNVENAIKKASAKDAATLEESNYEGYGPHGVAVWVETATDNPTRTVANVRSYFNKVNGQLGTSGSLEFIFDRKGVFTIPAAGIDRDELELTLIENGAEDIQEQDDDIIAYTSFQDFITMQRALETAGIAVTSAELRRIPNNLVTLTDEQAEDIIKLIDKLEEDDDVQNVFHNMNESE
ncbi:MAG: YebC/PmpR family DNA-binding transcriptional regulator [Ignavibacteria bacterium]|nr:YebC/PmpR family DNA-binding transcriptional regulator [Ignavibacteria bacterium]MBP6508982.1 YebC/PmpR family DNA-binding transcriptional regulator [Candidatus Kapabacteria bacterium]MBK6420019.1 YebC/PmpR family DNA-binding transcriptional regulator [Ignavibacteria bacterium]MBK6759349.1 YebC/PmpR family DNA-binding transcriptional regulator [Ignavibacteria bacterium]MBK7034199.1 YebC/PmpR family DNA-binding transcriptional regulator [Ignavibacteria bacterium]